MKYTVVVKVPTTAGPRTPGIVLHIPLCKNRRVVRNHARPRRCSTRYIRCKYQSKAPGTTFSLAALSGRVIVVIFFGLVVPSLRQ